MTPKDKTALLVIDVQNGFKNKGYGFYTPMLKDVLPKIKELIRKCRNACIIPIYLRYALSKNQKKHPKNNIGKLEKKYWVDGMPATKICSEIKPKKDDIVITKQTFSGFVNTPLKRELDALKINSLIICGVSTDACVRATLFDAYDYDYKIVLIEDCTGSEKKDHKSNLKDFKRLLEFIKIKKLKDIKF